jgi:AcrR family transcriptional regulator
VNVRRWSRLSAEARRGQLVAVAAPVIVERGIHGFRLKDVADAAGVSQPLVSSYFSTRDELVVAAFETADERSFDDIKAIAQTQPDAFQGVQAVVLESLSLDPLRAISWDLWLQVWAYGRFSAEIRAAIERRQAAWVALVADVVAAGRADGSVSRDVDAARVAPLIVVSLDGVSSVLRCGLMSEAEASRICVDVIDATLRTEREAVTNVV